MSSIEFEDSKFYEACKDGDEKLVRLMIESACGWENIARLMIEKGADGWNSGLFYACRSGYEKLVQLMIEKGADDWNEGLHAACLCGNEKLIHLMIEKGANNWNDCLLVACTNGNEKLVHMFIEKGANDWNRGLANACSVRCINIDLIMLKHGATNTETINNNMMFQILNSGKLDEGEIIKFFGKRGTKAVDRRKKMIASITMCLRDRITYDVLKHVVCPMIGYTV